MLRPQAVVGLARWPASLGTGLIVASVAGSVVVVLLAPADHLGALSVVLGGAAIVAGLLVEGQTGGAYVSSSYLIMMLAASLLGPRSAVAAGLLSEFAASIRTKTPLTWVRLNVPAMMACATAAAVLVRALAGPRADRLGFYLAVALAGVVVFLLSFALMVALRRTLRPDTAQVGIGVLVESLPGAALSLLLAVAGTAITLKVGTAGIVFALAAVFTFSYMAHLLRESRQRAQQYVSLSWGVLAGLMRALDVRDQRAARHAAAVARFARDMAAAVDMSPAEQELAHTAGLLHDIGHFALSDRVAERGKVLNDEDWMTIQQHPELGAEMLRDLGLYGPVAEIILAHHERIDGRGYPLGMLGEEIPELAKIISVAEVYDTLTASDTYRTRMSSFEALNELRRVSGSQLDGRYVEVLAGLLSGEGVDYRHADTADFDSELDMERRIREARTG